jgi:elongation factor G
MNSHLDRHFYRETVRNPGTGEGRVCRQQGAVGVYAHVRVAVRPTGRGQGVHIAWEAGSNIPPRFLSAVVEGVRDALSVGILEGVEMTDLHASVEDGSYHDVDSTADAFREAAEKATAEALRQGQPALLEASVKITVTVPAVFLAVVEEIVISSGGRLSKKEFGVQGSVIETLMPAPQGSRFITRILEATEGRSTFSMVVAGFEVKPEPPDTMGPWASVT